MTTAISVPQGQFHLARLPLKQNDLLRAWDAADEYLLHHVYDQNLDQGSIVTLLNDNFGTLAVTLNQYHPIALSDSYLSHLATQHNLKHNNISIDTVTLGNSLTPPTNKIDYLLIKPPKTLALLEHQLCQLQPLLHEASKIILAGMIKNMPPAIWQLLENIIGPTTTSLAVKKARLIFANLDPTIKTRPSPYPTSYQLENTTFRIWNHANVFSREKLDIGSRFLLQHLPTNPEYREFIDLGCGNGIIGLILASSLPNIKIHFIDESYMAIASAKMNFQTAFKHSEQATFKVNNGLDDFPANSADCIVCNPPFHQQHTIGDHIAWQMFKQSWQVLRTKGELRIIGNRHLNYHIHLKRLFGNCQQVASNDKFVILKSFKR